MQQICADLHAEYEDLRSFLVGLVEAQWRLPTPADGWTIHDQISHLACFDEQAVFAYEKPDAFAVEIAELMQSEDPFSFVDAQVASTRDMTGAEMLAWWDRAHAGIISTFGPLDPKTRMIWYGPPMSVRSKVTARLMETWAHGQDIVDALGCKRPVTNRIRHVCHIGVKARAFAYATNGLKRPKTDVHVALTGPFGDSWQWGDPQCGQQISGPAIDFALVATQRRHVDDCDLEATGPDAEEWLQIVQTFAGPPGTGRKPGQFA